jgi:hypothetical protein
MVMGGVSWKGGNQKVVKPMATPQLKMEDTYILYNVIEIFQQKKVTKVERWGPFVPFKLQMGLA